MSISLLFIFQGFSAEPSKDENGQINYLFWNCGKCILFFYVLEAVSLVYFQGIYCVQILIVFFVFLVIPGQVKVCFLNIL